VNPNGSHWLTDVKREAIQQRHRRRCTFCLVYLANVPRRRRHIDHLIPREQGGSNHESNLVLACADCNGRKGKTPYDVYAAPAVVARIEQERHEPLDIKAAKAAVARRRARRAQRTQGGR
jgi:5-methylcytosine-specific restriction endonuclease McrA